MKRTARRSPLLCLVVSALVAGCGLFPKESTTQEPELPEPPQVSSAVTYPVERADIALTIQGSAEVTPVREVALYFKESGRIKETTAVAGQRVAAGTVLARLDIGDLEHQLRLARIDLRIAELQEMALEATGATVYDRSIQELVVERQKETAGYLQERVDRCAIRAPFDGIVRSVQYEVSDPVADYATVIVLTDPSTLELQMEVSAGQFDSVTQGREARVRTQEDVWVPTSVIETTRRSLGGDAAARREEYIVHLSLPAGLADAPPGRVLASEIILEKRSAALVIPLAALREFQGHSYVRVLEGDLRREVDVSVGIRTDTQAEILEGLTEGQKVIGR